MKFRITTWNPDFPDEKFTTKLTGVDFSSVFSRHVYEACVKAGLKGINLCLMFHTMMGEREFSMTLVQDQLECGQIYRWSPNDDDYTEYEIERLN